MTTMTIDHIADVFLDNTKHLGIIATVQQIVYGKADMTQNMKRDLLEGALQAINVLPMESPECRALAAATVRACMTELSRNDPTITRTSFVRILSAAAHGME